MKSTADLVRGFIRKAESDLENATLCLNAHRAMDTACFHCQQAAEKILKAYLGAKGVEIPLIHNIEKLIEHCMSLDSTFFEIRLLGQELTPYAVQLRYDFDFWPIEETARQAHKIATTIIEFVLPRIPQSMK